MHKKRIIVAHYDIQVETYGKWERFFSDKKKKLIKNTINSKNSVWEKKIKSKRKVRRQRGKKLNKHDNKFAETRLKKFSLKRSALVNKVLKSNNDKRNTCLSIACDLRVYGD
uniref:Uncharacterized protein n=1 Tax=Glossina pallidipes TaxID=7398 RepID=A0A1B0A8A0_GLOPL